MTDTSVRAEPAPGPDGDPAWEQCPSCGDLVYGQRLARNLRVCPGCGYHHRLTGQERIGQLFDPGSFEPLPGTGAPAIGPPAGVMRKLGDKSTARAMMREAGLPLLPGGVQTLDSAAEAERYADEIGYPVIIKAAAGGGGRGMTVVRSAGTFAGDYARTRATGLAVFGDDRVYVERYLDRGRHVEVQILCDQHGTGIVARLTGRRGG